MFPVEEDYHVIHYHDSTDMVVWVMVEDHGSAGNMMVKDVRTIMSLHYHILHHHVGGTTMVVLHHDPHHHGVLGCGNVRKW